MKYIYNWKTTLIIACVLVLCISFLFVRKNTGLFGMQETSSEPLQAAGYDAFGEDSGYPDFLSEPEQETEPELETEPEPEPVRIGFRVIPADAKEADISYLNVKKLHVDMDEVFAQLPDLKKIYMIGCGLSNEEYAQLQDNHPDIRIIWEIKLSHWTIRTDVVAFSTMKTTGDPFYMDNDEAYYLKYCTDLVALDLGHNHVCDLSFLQYMPELRVLILVDEVDYFDYDGAHYLTDISMLQYVPKLKYLEIFANGVRDYGPIAYLHDLEHLNISNTYGDDVRPLLDLPKLKRLWMETTNIGYYDYLYLVNLYPNTRIVYIGEGSVDQGWREGEYYEAMRDMFRNNYLNEIYE